MIAGIDAQSSAAVCGVAWLAELAFVSGTVRVTTAPQNIVAGGNTFIGLGSVVTVSGVKESADTSREQLTLSLSIVDTAMLALALGSVEGYRGKPAKLYLQLLNEAWQPVGSALLRWAGVMDKVVINRKSPSADGGAGGAATGTIDMQCSRSGLARSRNVLGLRLTDAQQQAPSRYPGDTGLRYVRTLVEQPSLWLSKAFQEQH